MKPKVRAAWTSGALVAVMLAGCSGTVPSVDDVTIPFRNPTAPIGVTSRYDDALFAGSWHVRGAFPLDADLVQVKRLADAADGPVWELLGRSCTVGGDCADVR